VSKTVWLVVVMGLVTAMVLAFGMMISLSQFQEVPAAEWVKLAESTTHEFKLENVSVRVNLNSVPSVMRIGYLTRADSKFDLTQQNVEMEKIANFAVQNYKGREMGQIDQVQINRSETHGSGCFQQTYVANFTLANPRLRTGPGNLPGPPGRPPFPPREK
jgi:hypothetical protein